MSEVNNALFAKSNALFRRACAAVNTEPTSRQAGKFRRKCGIAFSALSLLKKQSSAMTVKELRAAVKKDMPSVTGISKMKKADLISLLNTPVGVSGS